LCAHLHRQHVKGIL